MNPYRIDMRACVEGIVATLLVANTGIALMEFGLVDNSLWAARTITTLSGLTALTVYLWRRERGDAGSS